MTQRENWSDFERLVLRTFSLRSGNFSLTMIPPVDDVSLQSHFDLLVRPDSGGLLPADEHSSNFHCVSSIKNHCLSRIIHPPAT